LIAAFISLFATFMGISVYFDTKAKLRAEEIERVWADGVLAAKADPQAILA
jgi:hypothetical protein